MVIDYGKIIFGDVDSSEYGIYISGEGVYNAPERAVEFVDVPGRNGAIALDQGRYENISITYPALLLEDDQENFREKLSDFRNAILSQRGYQRLEDSYHPEEYRMGLYASGLEVSRVFRKMRGGEFELTFNCKPQRWLSVGEYPIPVDSGDILENITPFDAGPLLEVEGYGNINFNGYNIDVQNAPLGETTILTLDTSGMNTGDTSRTYDTNGSIFNVGDTIKVKPATFRFDFVYLGGSSGISVSQTAADVTPTVESTHRGGSFSVVVTFPTTTFTAPANGAFSAKSYMATVTMTPLSGTAATATIIAQVIVYGKDGDNPPNISFIASITVDTTDSRYLTHGSQITETGATVDSTVPILGHPTYIDCGQGEAYKIENDVLVSLNRAIAFGSDLPVLAPGPNKVTFDNTVTDLKIAPRWWRV